jgi:hypothetical protein
MLVARVDLAAADRFDDLVGKLSDGAGPTAAMLRTLILPGRDHDGLVSAVAYK